MLFSPLRVTENFCSASCNTGSGGNLTTDAHLTALAVEHKAVSHTADTDFLRFGDVRWVNPLVVASKR